MEQLGWRMSGREVGGAVIGERAKSSEPVRRSAAAASAVGPFAAISAVSLARRPSGGGGGGGTSNRERKREKRAAAVDRVRVLPSSSSGAAAAVRVRLGRLAT